MNGARAQSRWQFWRSQPPFTDTSLFERRLAADGLKRDEFLHLLGEEAAALAARSPNDPDWLTELHRAFTDRPDPTTDPLPQDAPDRVNLCEVLGPLLRPAHARVRDRAEELVAGRGTQPFDPAPAVELLFAGLLWQVRRMTDRTLILELHVARLRDELPGDTPIDRFRSFQERLRCPEVMLALLREYPVLARQLVLCLQRWTAVSLEFLERLVTDYETLQQVFSPEANLGPLVHVHAGAGDSHRGGRSVIIARFQSGLQLVYKPRSLAGDRHFQELLAWLDERGDHPPFRILKVLDRGDHGWVEYVEAHDCADVAEVRRFYERQGAYLALLYALEATDFHSENLIAAGEHPVLVDLEALFHPRLSGTMTPGPAEDALDHSVFRVGLLPERSWPTEQSAGVDASGLGSAEGQLAPYLTPQWEGLGTDEMRLVRKRVPMPVHQNRPTLAGAGVNLLDYQEEIIRGFVRTYRLLERHRTELMAANGPLASFADDEVRVILRRTQAYGMLAYESYHPDVLRDALDRDRLLDRLWIGGNHFPYLEQIIPAERADLLQGDIPLFTTRPGTRDLWTAAGERLADFFDESGLEQVRRQIGRFGDDDLERQVWLIRGSLATVAMAEAKMPSYVMSETGEIDRQRLLDAARAVGDRLEERAVWKDGAVSWLTMSLMKEHHWALIPMGADLYNGVPGMALFLAHLGKLTGTERYTRLARAALATLRRQIAKSRQPEKSVGAFEGWGGIIYALAHLGALWGEPELFAEAEQFVALLPPLIAQEEKLDIIAGSAGCIAGLLSLHHCVPSLRTLAVARQCGDKLLERAQPMPHGAAWQSVMASRGPLTGFSHGAAGIAFSLLELARATGEDRFRTQALAAIAYERSLFVSAEGNWPNLSLPVDGVRDTHRQEPIHPFLVSWCHGAPGIGLARLRGLRHLDDQATRAEIDVALRTTLTQGFGRNHTLCHGDLGNLELLVEAGRMLADSEWRFETNRLAAGILNSIERDGFLCATPLAVQTPGLMTGLAGIGYGLLRLAEPEKVPSVLTLAPPGSSFRRARKSRAAGEES